MKYYERSYINAGGCDKFLTNGFHVNKPMDATKSLFLPGGATNIKFPHPGVKLFMPGLLTIVQKFEKISPRTWGATVRCLSAGETEIGIGQEEETEAEIETGAEVEAEIEKETDIRVGIGTGEEGIKTKTERDITIVAETKKAKAHGKYWKKSHAHMLKAHIYYDINDKCKKSGNYSSAPKPLASKPASPPRSKTSPESSPAAASEPTAGCARKQQICFWPI